MKCRPKPNSTQKQEKNIRSAPKRGGLLYWTYVVVFTFILPMIAIPITMGLVLNFIFDPISPKAIMAIMIISPFIAFFIARKAHRRLMQLPDDKYEECFNQPVIIKSFPEDSGTYLDRGDPTYWTLGPGRKERE